MRGPARSLRPLLLLPLLALVAGASAARSARPRLELGPSGIGPCPGAAIAPTRVLEGFVPGDLEGAYLMFPFDVPAGTTLVRVKYCWESGGHTLDLGLWQARRGHRPWGPEQFRGWGGSSHPDVAVSVQGFSDEATYLADPKGYVPGRTTRGFVPGPIPPGEWAAEIGVGAVLTREEGDDDGRVAFRIEIALPTDAAFAAEPYVPAPYSEAAVRPGPAWFVGDMHVHAEHSALGDATMSETFDVAFRPLDQGGAGLDFLALSDYVTTTGWGEIGRYQALHPQNLIIASTEIITYEGHANNHQSRTYVDHRMGPIYEVREDGSLRRTSRHGNRPRRAFRTIQKAGGWTQLNHVATCPSTTEYCRRTCRGCPWDHGRKETGFGHVDAIEIASGPLDLFIPGAIEFWEAALARGGRIAAVGSSDAHHAGSPQDGTQASVGEVATAVYASELSSQAIGDAVRAGHTYVKMAGAGGPDLRLEARVEGSTRPPVMMGDVLRARAKKVRMTARVLGVPADAPATLRVVRNGATVTELPVADPDFTYEFTPEGSGRYHLELEDPSGYLGLTSPIYLR